MAEKKAAIMYFKHMRQVMCENVLRTIPQKNYCIQSQDYRKKFYDMAIKALEQEPCDDCVSRKEPFRFYDWYKVIGQYKNEIHKNAIKDLSDIMDSMPDDTCADWRDSLAYAICVMSSVQPKQEKGEWIKTQLGTVCNKCYRFPLLNKDENEILSNYCPYCGADMRTESEETE